MSDSRTFSNDSDFAAEQGRKGGANQPDEIYKRESIHCTVKLSHASGAGG